MSEAYTTDYSRWQPRAETRNRTEDEGTRVRLADAPLWGLGMSGNRVSPRPSIGTLGKTASTKGRGGRGA